MDNQTLAIAATFTAEPVEESLHFWMQELDIASSIEFAPYNQVFQQLLDPTSLLSRNQKGINIILLRFEDWLKFGSDDKTTSSTVAYERIERNVRDLGLALASAAQRSATPHLICVCPASVGAMADSQLAAFLKQMEELLASELEDTGGVYMVTTAELMAAYPVLIFDDPLADKLGKIPYTPAFFASLGSLIARRIYRLQSAPHKVVVLDCDQTLWRGVCGEVGARGVEIDSPYRALQQFMVAQHDSGMMVCLCSKNNEEDVAEVFELRQDMPLRRDHIVSWRINWRPKSENIKALAEELQLGLDSFIFIDDDPVACAEVGANCPEVLTLQLPPNAEDLPRFLAHVWAFDHLKITGEDRQRTALYRQNVKREDLRKESLSFADFLAGLGLTVEIMEMKPQHLVRVSQLTQRTNQFNCSTIKRSEAELQRLYQSGKAECLVVTVSDRFGDYGLVGAMIFETRAEALRLESFLLSCRALGRGVEHRMLARLGELARERKLERVDVNYVESGKNRPALEFLETVGTKHKDAMNGSYLYRFPAEFAAAVTFCSPAVEPMRSTEIVNKQPGTAISALQSSNGSATKPELMIRIAKDLSTAEEVLKAVESQNRRSRPQLGETYIAPRNHAEETLAMIWAEVLRLERIGVHDNFFELGGHSLLATVLMSRMRDTFQMDFSVPDFFEAPTIARFAGVIERYQIEQTDEEEVAEMLKELDELSDEEVRALLANERQSTQDSERM